MAGNWRWPSAVAAIALVVGLGAVERPHWFAAYAQTGGTAPDRETPDPDQSDDDVSPESDDGDEADATPKAAEREAGDEFSPGAVDADEQGVSAASKQDSDGAEVSNDDEGTVDGEEAGPKSEAEPEVEPDAETVAQWSDPPATVYEVRAVQVDADDYVKTCADKPACQKVVTFVGAQLSSLLTDYRQRSNRFRKEAGPSLGRSLKGTTKYRVLTGQQLELVANRPGPNDAAIWTAVTRVIPRPQSDRYVSRFHVFRKRGDSTLAFVEGDTESEKFILGINEPQHLGTDLREQYLTIAHEFMHMYVFEQFVGPDSFDENEKAKAKGIFSLENILNALFGQDKAQPAAVQASASQVAIQCDGIVDENGCFPKGSLFYDFTSRFWTKSDLQNNQKEGFYDKNAERFVTEYATSSPHEDISESFSWWVINEGKGKTVADAKQRFFGRYPQLVALKAQIRRAVIAEILKAEEAN